MTKLAISGRLRAGKDYLAHEMGCKVVSIADPMYFVSQHFLGTSDKDIPHVRKHLQMIGAWGRGQMDDAPSNIPDRETVTNFMRTNARSVLPAEYHDIEWEQYGKEEGFWVTATRQRTDRMLAANPNTPLAIVNARFIPEVQSFQSVGFTHLHVKCSPETRMKRVGPDYDPKMDQDFTELMAIEFDKPGRLDDRQIVWNDHVAPPKGTDFLTVHEAVAKYAVLRMPPEPSMTPEMSAPALAHAFA